MRISQATIGMESARSYRTANYSLKRFEETDFSNVLSGRSFGDEGKELEEGKNKEDLTEKKKPGGDKMITKEEILQMQQRVESTRRVYAVRSEEETDFETIRQKSIMYILELLFGRNSEKVRAWKEENYNNSGEVSKDTYKDGASLLTVDAAQLMQTPLRKLSYTAVDRYEEHESTSFSAKGMVRCADGREIGFNIDVSMSRSFVRESKVGLGIEYIQTCDPLVINLDGSVASVSDQKIRFDIDGDGKEDTVNRLNEGNGYLALDLNGDGKINDGNELFGAKSGDGFGDLAEYDEDGNGWIDEDDEIWQKLKIWVMDEKGRSKLYTLAEAGVGALCLNKMQTEFKDTDDNNSAKAFVRSTGIFLYENGMAGTLQHLDLVRYAEEA